MATTIAPRGYRVLSPTENLTGAASGERQSLDERVWARVSDYHGTLDPTLKDIMQRVDELYTWGTHRRDGVARPPSSETIEYAREVIRILYLEVRDSGLRWINPLISANEDGEVTFEWQRQGRRLTFRVSETGVGFSKLWGNRPNFQFEDDTAGTKHRRYNLWAWLAN
jgi:hypothetical protein